MIQAANAMKISQEKAVASEERSEQGSQVIAVRHEDLKQCLAAVLHDMICNGGLIDTAAENCVALLKKQAICEQQMKNHDI